MNEAARGHRCLEGIEQFSATKEGIGLGIIIVIE
jgi:hypothetical protein